MAFVEKAATKRTKDGKPQPSYRVRWMENVRDEMGLPIPLDPSRPDGQKKQVHRRETFPSKELAQERCDELNAARHRAAPHTPSELRKLGDQPIGYFASAFFDGMLGTVKPRTLKETKAVYHRYLAEPFGPKAVASITAADVRRFRASLLSPRPKRRYRPDEQPVMVTLARSTVKHAYDVLRRILDVAVVDGAIPANPCHSVRLPRKTSAESDKPEFAPQPLTSEQISSVADHIARVQGYPIYALAVTFSTFTGVRAGELAGLNVGDILLPEVEGRGGAVRVVRTRRPIRGGWETGTPKSKRSRRTVPMDGWLTDDIRRYLLDVHPHGDPESSDFDPEAPLFPGRYAKGEALPDGLTREAIGSERATTFSAEVRRKDGQLDRRNSVADPTATCLRVAPPDGYKWTAPINPANVADHYFDPALKALGLPHSRWHDLRHTFAVLSLSAGEHYMAVSKWLGHASFVTTLNVYADYIAEDEGGKKAPLLRPGGVAAEPEAAQAQPQPSNVVPLFGRRSTG
ncbi:tyrosine-type recombinase/integrase [Rhodococcus qingshengii]